jgi:hypothetical protein
MENPMHLPALLPSAATAQHALTLRLSPENRPFRSAALPFRASAPERAGKAGRERLPTSGPAHRPAASAQSEASAIRREIVETVRIVAWIVPAIARGAAKDVSTLVALALFIPGMVLGLAAMVPMVLR